MKILFLTNKVPYPPKDGGSIATLGIIKAFADAGHSATVLSMNTRKHHITPFDIPQKLSSQIIFHLVEVPALISIKGAVRNLLFSKLPYNAERFIDKNYQQKLETLLSAHTYDIIQLEGLYLIPYIPLIRKSSSATIAYRSHNIEHEIWERTASQTSGLKRFYLKILSKRIRNLELTTLNQYDLLVPITQRDNETYTELGNRKPSQVIAAGFDENNAFPSKKSTANNLFFLGALDWPPNQEGLVWFLDNCWPIIKKKRPQSELLIAGRNAPKWFISKLKSYKITYKGEIEYARDFILKNGVMIAPLMSGGGMRVKIIEGMLNQKAIITTTIGCEGIAAENEKHLFIADEPEAFAHYALSLLKHKGKAEQVGKLAHLFATQFFNNKELNKQLVAFYNQYIK